VRISSKPEFDELLESYLIWRRQFLDESGELKPPFSRRHSWLLSCNSLA